MKYVSTTCLSDASALTLFPSDVESLRNGIIKTSKNNKAAFYTIVLVGEPGVGKTSFASFIANALSGHSIDNYSFHDTNSFDDTDEQSGSANQSQASEARLHKFTSKNGTVVSFSFFNVVSRHNLFVRFTSSTPLG